MYWLWLKARVIIGLLVLSGLLFQSNLLIRAVPSETPVSKWESRVLRRQGWVSSCSLYYLRHQRSCAASAVGARHDSSAGSLTTQAKCLSFPLSVIQGFSRLIWGWGL